MVGEATYYVKPPPPPPAKSTSEKLYTLVGAEVNAGLADRALSAPLESVILSLPGLGADSPLLGAAEIALEPLFVDPVAALGSSLVDARGRLAG